MTSGCKRAAEDEPLRVRTVGERNLIRRIAGLLPPLPGGRINGPAGVPEGAAGAPRYPVGIGDDAAYVPEGSGGWLVTTDMLVEGVHFRWDWTDPEQLGHKAVAVNLSDIAAMGGEPVAAFTSISLPGEETVARVEAFYRGVAAGLAEHGAHLLGGDTVGATGGWAIDVTVLGRPGPWGPRWRRGARPGDVAVVTGRLGAAYGGYRLLAAGVRWPGQTPAEHSLLAAHLLPRPQLAAARVVAPYAHALTDISDGLFAELTELGTEQGLGVEVRAAALPVDAETREAAARWGEDPLAWALYGGEDYTLLAAVPPEAMAALRRAAARAGVALAAVGRFDQAPGVRLHTDGGEAVTLHDHGFDAFRLEWPPPVVG